MCVSERGERKRRRGCAGVLRIDGQSLRPQSSRFADLKPDWKRSHLHLGARPSRQTGGHVGPSASRRRLRAGEGGAFSSPRSDPCNPSPFPSVSIFAIYFFSDHHPTSESPLSQHHGRDARARVCVCVCAGLSDEVENASYGQGRAAALTPNDLCSSPLHCPTVHVVTKLRRADAGNDD